MELVGELVPGPAAPGAFRVAALDHEVRDHAMKDGAIVKRFAGLGSFRQVDKIFDGLRHPVGMQFDFEFALGGIESGVCFIGHHRDCNSQPARPEREWLTPAMLDFASAVGFPGPRLWALQYIMPAMHTKLSNPLSIEEHRQLAHEISAT